jgi:hypothetical protein
MVHWEQALCALRRQVLGHDWAVKKRQVEPRSPPQPRALHPQPIPIESDAIVRPVE